jgi:hypothetical protein
MRIKIQIPNKFYIWLKSEIEKKKSISQKDQEKFKRMRIKFDMKNKSKLMIKGWNWKE